MSEVQESFGEKYISSSSIWHRLPVAFFVLGILCLVYVFGQFRVDLQRALFSYHFGVVSILSIALGCMIFVLIQHATRAGWSVVVRRVFENGMATMPLFFVLCIPIFYFAPDLFEWVHVSPSDHVLMAKRPYLNLDFFYVRALFYFSVWLLISFFFFRMSIKQDDGQSQEKTKLLAAVSAPSILLYGLTTTFAAFDWIMSLEPHWYSTMYGVYFFAGSLLSGIAFCTLITMALQNVGVLLFVSKEHYQDLGKLLFAFTVFWAYIAFSQFMLYWYANIPEEMEFFAHRVKHGWENISWFLLFGNFFLPFFALMSRHVKRNKLTLAVLCIWVLVTHFVDLFWLILPAYHPHHGEVSRAMFTEIDFLALLGCFSLFLACVMYLLSRYSVFPSGDPKLLESIAFENM